MKSVEPDPLVTECPHCDTRFRVTDSQLALADGRVRCGACLTVFAGTDYLQFDGSVVSSEEPDLALDELLNELDEDENELEALLRTEAETQLSDNEKGSHKSGSTENSLDHGPEMGPSSETTAREQEQEQEREQEQEDDPDALIQDTQEFPVFSGLGDGLDEAREIEGFGIAASATSNLGPQLFVVLPSDDEVVDENRSEEGNENSPVEVTEQDIVSAEEGSDKPSDQEREAVAEKPKFDLDNLKVEPAAIEALYSQLHFAEKPRSRWIPWAFFVGIVAITFQVFYYQFDTWGKIQSLRPVYGLACDLLGCELPIVRSLVDIRSRSSSVRPHEELADTLSVEALIVNEAGFAQPFPTVELRFTTLLGNLVTTYRIRPEQYLEGELTGVVDMQPLQPVRIAFEVPDPGNDAENYAINFM